MAKELGATRKKRITETVDEIYLVAWGGEAIATHVELKLQQGKAPAMAALAIRDSGSPVSIIRMGAIDARELEQYAGRPVRWGQSGRLRIRGKVRMTVQWTEKTVQHDDFIVVSDAELPDGVDALIGNDVIRGRPYWLREDSATKTHQVIFDGDDVPVTLLGTVGQVEEARERVWNQRIGMEPNMQLSYQRREKEVHVACVGGACSKETPPDRLVFTVVSQDLVVIPPWSQRALVGRLEMGRKKPLRKDATALFTPEMDARVSAWTVEFDIAAGNDQPWVHVNVMNTTREPIFVTKNEVIGEARTNYDVVRMTDGRGYAVSDVVDATVGGKGGQKTVTDAPPTVETTRPKGETTKRVQMKEAPHAGSGKAEEMTTAFKADARDGAWAGAEEQEESAQTVWTTNNRAQQGEERPRDGPGFTIGGGETEEERERMFVSGIVDEKKALEEFEELKRRVEQGLLKETGLTDQQRKDAWQALADHKKMFTEPNRARRDHKDYPFYIRVPTVSPSPVNIRTYRYPADKLAALHDWADAQLSKGHIEFTTSAWNSPMVLTRKKDGRWRFAVDMRGVNAVASYDPYLLPQIPDLLELTAGAQWFSAMDLTDGYWNVLIHPDDREKFAITIPGKGRFQWRSMPFGYSGSGPHFQRAVEACLAGLKWSEVAVYIDDVLLFSKDFDEHVALVNTVLGRLAEGGFVVAPRKCTFFQREVPYLGHRLSQRGVDVQPGLVDKIKESMTAWRTKTDLRRALGVAQFYAKFVWQFADVAAPLSDATKKEVSEDLSSLSAEQLQALRAASKRMADLMTSTPTLALPDYDREFVLITDASDVGIGAVLGQEYEDGYLRPIAFWSRKLSETERNYSATEREALAVVFFVNKFRYYLLGRHFLLKTDHRALQYIFKGATDNSKLARWSLRLQEFSFDTVHVPGKENLVPDYLSRPADWTPVLEWNVSRRQGLYVRAPGLVEAGEVIVPARRIALEPGTLAESVLGVANLNNEAEGQPGQKNGDSDVASDAAVLGPKKIQIGVLQEADAEVQMLREMMETVGKEGVETPERDATLFGRRAKAAVAAHRLKSDGGLLKYMSEARDYQGKLELKRERIVAPMVLRRLLMADAHDATWAGHFATERTLERLRRHWWWPTMKEDVAMWIEECDDCTRAGKGKRKPFGKLRPLAPVLRPFERMAMDLLEVARPTADVAFPYALVVMDYATRYAIIVPLPNKESRTIASAITERVIGVFGPPEELLSDNGPEFRGVVPELAQAFGIRQTFVTTYHPRANGLVERFNSTLLAMLRTTLDEFAYQRWEKLIPAVQYAYNSSRQSSLGESPHFLMFGREPQSPLEMQIEWPAAEKQKWDEWVRRLLQARDTAREALMDAQRQQAARFDVGRAEVDLKAGDRVFLRNGRVPDGANPKTAHRQRGPYRVRQYTHGTDVVDLEHELAQDETLRVSVDRVTRARGTPEEPLTTEEQAILDEWRLLNPGMPVQTAVAAESMELESASAAAQNDGGNVVPQIEDEVDVPLADVAPPARAVEWELARVLGHRETGDGQQFLVEFKTVAGPRLALWTDNDRIDAPQLIDEYWQRFNHQELETVQTWKKKCRGNGNDVGCEHLKCKAKSWARAMKDYVQDAKKKLAPKNLA